MAQIFHRSTNTISRFTIYGFVFVLAALSWALYIWQGSGWFNRMGEAEEQPVPFSHAHHAGGLGIDCRYCTPRWRPPASPASRPPRPA